MGEYQAAAMLNISHFSLNKHVPVEVEVEGKEGILGQFLKMLTNAYENPPATHHPRARKRARGRQAQKKTKQKRTYTEADPPHTAPPVSKNAYECLREG